MIEESPQTSLRSGASSCGMDRCCPSIVTSCGDHAHAPPDQGKAAALGKRKRAEIARKAAATRWKSTAK
jgi:hypothetical protein